MTDVDYLHQWVMLAVQRLHPDAFSTLIRDEIKKCTARTYTTGQISTVVYQLQEKGFIWKLPPKTTKGRVRTKPHIFNLTEQGEITLEQWLRAIDSLRPGAK